MPEDKVTEALRFAAEPLSLSEPLREDGDAELGDIVEDRSAESPFEVAATALLPGRDREAARPARRARAPDPGAALRSRPRRAAHARRGRRVLQPHPGAHPPDRGPGDVEAAPPVAPTPAPATCSPSERLALQDVRHSRVRHCNSARARAIAVVEDVDVSSLDAGHVLPNMHPTSERGRLVPGGWLVGLTFRQRCAYPHISGGKRATSQLAACREILD